MRKTKLINRLISGALTAVMLLGMMPTGALATSGGGTHGGSAGSVGNSGTDPRGWNWTTNAFSRYTLVELRDGADKSDTYTVLGTMDIVQDRRASMIGQHWWVGTNYGAGNYTADNGMNTVDAGGARPMNALDYIKHDATALANSSTLWGDAGDFYAVTQSEFPTIGAKVFEAYKKAFPESEALASRPELFDSSLLDSSIIGSYRDKVNADQTENNHIEQFGTKLNKDSNAICSLK